MTNTQERLAVLVYGDSISMPRSFDGIGCHQIYPEIIKEFNGAMIFNRSQGGLGIKDIYSQFQRDSAYFDGHRNKILIIQTGIVDCAPRPIPFWLKRCISKLPGMMRKPIVGFLHANRPQIQKFVRWRLTSPAIFEKIFAQWLNDGLQTFKRIYIINIFPATKEISLHSPGLAESIKEYNKIIKQQVIYKNHPSVILINAYEALNKNEEDVGKWVSSKDGHHLTLEGHRWIAEQIIHYETAHGRD